MPEVEIPQPEELEETRARRFNRQVALITAIFAVVLAVCHMGGSMATKNMLLAQQQASDQWAWYQGKNIRGHISRSSKNLLELLAMESPDPVVKKRYEEMQRRAAAEEASYAADKKEIETEARNLERERDLYRRKDPYFEYGEVLLAISIVMASIAILARSRMALSFGLVTAVLGALMTVNGFLMIVHLPFLGH